MWHIVEALESRTLLSTTPAPVAVLLNDRTTLKALLKADKANTKNCVKTAVADLRTLTTDLHKTHNAQNLTFAKTVQFDVLSGVGLLDADLKKLFSTGSAAGQHLVADALRLVKNALNAALIGRINADATVLFNLTVNNVFGNDSTSVQNSISADLNQIASANPSDANLQADAAADQAAVQQCATMAQNDGNALTNALGTLFIHVRSLVPTGQV